MIQSLDLKKSFGSSLVLKGVTFHIEKGESVVIIGRSGCGKSILLKHLIGLLMPDAGKILVEGQNLAQMSERELLRVRRRFGMLFQSAALFDSLSVAENVSFPLRNENTLTDKEIKRRVGEALELVDLPGTQNRKPAELSGGMRKRVGLARAIVYRPQILLYDEPTTGLDPVVSDSIDRLIMRVCEQLNVTSVVVTHDMRSTQRVAHRVFLLHSGQIYFSGTPEEVFRSQDPIIHRFVNGISDPKEQNL